MNEYTKQAIIDAYQSGLSAVKVAEQFDTSATTVNRLVKKAGVNRGHKQAMRQIRDRRHEEYALTGGRWVNVRGVMRWQEVSDEELREAHARFFNGCRAPETRDGERLYQRNKKREQTAKKAAA